MYFKNIETDKLAAQAHNVNQQRIAAQRMMDVAEKKKRLKVKPNAPR